jgi:hypothetical protein
MVLSHDIIYYNLIIIYYNLIIIYCVQMNNQFRIKIYNDAKRIFDKEPNCDKIVNFIESHKKKILGQGIESKIYLLQIKNIGVALKTLPYNDDSNYSWTSWKGKNDIHWVKYMNELMDFMLESNLSGNDYFPYIYTVLNCHNGENSNEYIFYEAFDGDMWKMLLRTKNKYELYDIFFQLININYYLEVQNNMKYYDGKPKNHLFKRLDKPIKKTYNFDSNEYTFEHHYVIVIWDFHIIDKYFSNKEFVRNFDWAMQHIRKYKKSEVPIELIKLTDDIKEHPESTPKLLYEFYQKYVIRS